MIFTSSGMLGSGQAGGPLYTTHPAIHINSDSDLITLKSSGGCIGSGTGSDPYVIQGFEITGSGGACIYIGNTTDYLVIGHNYLHDNIFGISLVSSSNVTISDNVCSNNSKNGIDLLFSNNVTISKNNCEDYIHGIYLVSSRNNLLTNNICKGVSRCGIMLLVSDNNKLLNNTSSVSGNNGLHLESSNNNTVSNNTFNGNANDGIFTALGDNNTITNNNCNDNNYNGVRLASSSRNTVSNNTCNHNLFAGIYLKYSNNDIITENNCSSNTHYAFYLESSNNSLLYGNELINNDGASSVYDPSHAQAYDDGANRWNSSSYGNYWSDWSMPDADADGIVDMPYAITGGSNVDNLPTTFIVRLDKVGPSVIVSPNGSGIAIDAKIVVQFSEPMNLSSVSIIISGSVEGNVTFERNNATYTPNALESDKDYIVTVTGDDLAGNSVRKTWTFSTIRTVGVVTGTIKNEEGSPVAAASIALNNGAATSTDADGNFVFNGVSPGSYNITVNKVGYNNMTFNLTVTAGTTNALGIKTMTATSQSPGSSSLDMTLLLLGIVLVIIIVAGAGLIYMRRKRKAP